LQSLRKASLYEDVNKKEIEGSVRDANLPVAKCRGQQQQAAARVGIVQEERQGQTAAQRTPSNVKHVAFVHATAEGHLLIHSSALFF
jgi:hypothetical protein